MKKIESVVYDTILCKLNKGLESHVTTKELYSIFTKMVVVNKFRKLVPHGYCKYIEKHDIDGELAKCFIKVLQLDTVEDITAKRKQVTRDIQGISDNVGNKLTMLFECKTFELMCQFFAWLLVGMFDNDSEVYDQCKDEPELRNKIAYVGKYLISVIFFTMKFGHREELDKRVWNIIMCTDASSVLDEVMEYIKS